MDDVRGELVFVDEVVFEGASADEAVGTEGTAVVAGALAEQDVESEVTASGKCEVAAGAAMRGAARLVVCDGERCWRARRAVTSWERQSGRGVVGKRGVSGARRAVSSCSMRIVFILSSGWRRWYAFVRSGACI